MHGIKMKSDNVATVEVKVYDLSFRLLNNDTVQVKSEARGWDWAQRPAKEFGFTDSHLGAIRHMIYNTRGLFPQVPPVAAKEEPLKPVERKQSLEPV